MARPEYLQILTKSERAQAIKLGMAHALHTNGLSLADADQVIKEAAGFEISPSGMVGDAGKAFLALSLLLGAPLGAAWHGVERKVKRNPAEEKERLARIKHYRDVSNQLETGLAEAGA